MLVNGIIIMTILNNDAVMYEKMHSILSEFNTVRKELFDNNIFSFNMKWNTINV